VSHSKEREEKNCLNCGAALTDRYCQNCGQENTEPKETLWTLVSHFFNDITHFDGKFFSTVKYLITKPGFLSAEYIKGRRAGYLHPIRMYVFTSAFFFIIFFSLFNPVDLINGDKDDAEQLKELTEASSSLKEKLPGTGDADLKAAMRRSIINIDTHAAVLQSIVLVKERKDSIRRAKTNILLDSAGIKLRANPMVPNDLIDSIAVNTKKDPDGSKTGMDISKVEGFDYYSKIAYDSVQKELPANKRDGWFKRKIVNKVIIYKTKYKNDKKEAGALIVEKMLHTLPQALFVSLPVFAFILMLLYTRRKFYYADHAIFAIHFYCANFMILLLYFGIDKLKLATGWKWLSILEILLLLSIFYYLYKAMRKFYLQGRMKTILKFILLIIVFYIVVVILLVAFIMLSLMQFS
jgi:Protein of unknown function (DUF3667)